MPGRDFRPAAAKLKFAERGMIEGIAGQAIRIGDGADLFEPALRDLPAARWRWLG